MDREFNARTGEVLVEMLTENTGRALLDSGDFYGRNWERNQGMAMEDFEKEMHTRLEVYDSEFYYTTSLYQWLKERVFYRDDLQKLFEEFAEFADNSYWIQDAEQFPLWLLWKGYEMRSAVTYSRKGDKDVPLDESSSWEEVRSSYKLYGQYTFNTYNWDSTLSQDIQFAAFEYEETNIAMIQIHGGCDVRGGYTKPRAFEYDPWDYPLDGGSSAGLVCPTCKAEWSTDDCGWHWYPNRNTEFRIDKGVEIRAVYMDEYEEPKRTHRVETPSSVVVCPDENVVFCPHCGHKLEIVGW